MKRLLLVVLFCVISGLASAQDFPLKRLPLLTYVVDYEAAWSPDGKKIVLISSRHGGLKVHLLILACLNVAAQTMCPRYLRARALSFYLLVLQGGMALGATMWGALAKRIGVPDALAVAGVVLALGVLALRGHRITARELELSPAVVRD